MDEDKDEDVALVAMSHLKEATEMQVAGMEMGVGAEAGRGGSMSQVVEGVMTAGMEVILHIIATTGAQILKINVRMVMGRACFVMVMVVVEVGAPIVRVETLGMPLVRLGMLEEANGQEWF